MGRVPQVNHPLSVVCYSSILRITDISFHTDNYGLRPGYLLLIPFLIASFKSLYTLSPLTACLNHVHRRGGRSAMMTLRNLDVLSVIHHEVLPLLLAEVGIGNGLWVFGVVVCWYVPPSRYFSEEQLVAPLPLLVPGKLCPFPQKSPPRSSRPLCDRR